FAMPVEARRLRGDDEDQLSAWARLVLRTRRYGPAEPDELRQAHHDGQDTNEGTGHALSSGTLELHVFQRSGVREASGQVDAGLLHARADAPDERVLVDRHVRDPVVENLLDLVELYLALLDVDLAHLALEEILDLGNDAGRVGSALADVRLEPRRRVAAGAADADDDVLELALAPGRR